jgi:hypothetical protein
VTIALRGVRAALTLVVALALLGAIPAAHAAAQGLRWRLVAPEPPPPPAGVAGGEACSGAEASCGAAPIDLGRVGDVEFSAPNRGLLITAGNGTTVEPGIWEYDGAGWHELASVCGASDGRIAWAGGQEFWTISDGRPGQSANGQGLLPPLEDDTLCHFAVNPTSGSLEVVRSYAAPAFQASSYQPMRAAACLSPSDCWFGGAQLPAAQPGAFSLHWNGSAVEAQANTAADSAQDISAFEGRLLESVALAREEVQGEEEEPLEILHPFVLYEISSEPGAASFEGLRPFAPGDLALPEYAAGSYPAALAGMQLSVDTDANGEESLWAAAGPAATPPSGSDTGGLTVLRYAGGSWSQVLGPQAPATIAVDPASLEEDVVTSIAGEPGSSSAWLALDTQLDAAQPNPTALATLVHVQADGSLSEEQLPSASERAEGVAPQGAAADVACPAQNDCWLATTRGALFHLSEEDAQTLPVDGDRAFTSGSVITYRPRDEGLPQVPPSRPPGAEEDEEPAPNTSARSHRPPTSESHRVTVAPYSGARVRLLHGTTLELSFRLPVRARVRLLAERRTSVVASTPVRVLAAGRRVLRLQLNPRRWPTKLYLRVDPLAALPTVSVPGSALTGSSF